MIQATAALNEGKLPGHGSGRKHASLRDAKAHIESIRSRKALRLP